MGARIGCMRAHARPRMHARTCMRTHGTEPVIDCAELPAGAALAGAFDVFSELGLRSLTDLAAQGLQRLKQAHAV